MSHFSWVNRSLMVLLALLFVTGGALADFNAAPATPTGNYVAVHGSSGETDRFIGIHVASASLYIIGGQYYFSPNNNTGLFAHTTNTATFTNYVGGATTDGVLMEDHLRAATDYHYMFGTKIVTGGTEEYGRVTAFNNSATAVWNKDAEGEASEVTNFHAGILLANGTNAGDLLTVGNTTGSATGTVDAYFEILQITDGSLLNPADNTTTGATAVQWGTVGHSIRLNGVIEKSDGNLIVVGVDDTGSDDFYLLEVDQEGSPVGGFTGPDLTATGTLHNIVAGSGANEYVLVGETSDSPTKGFVALVTDNLDGTYTKQWERTFEHVTNATVLYDADIRADDGILVAGNQGETAFVAEVTDNGDNTSTEDWSTVYDLTASDGEVVLDIEVLSSGGFAAAGIVDDAGADTDGLFAEFAAPAVLPAAPTYNSPADAATALDHTDNADVGLDWTAGAGGSTVTGWDVYLSSTESEVTNEEVAALRADDQAAGTTTYDPTGIPLAFATTYYWKIVAVDGDNDENAGAVYSFTTQSNGPAQPTTASPADAATAIATTTGLGWADGVGGTDTDNWDVFFGTDSAAVANKTATQVATAQGVGTTTVDNSALNSGNPLATGTQYFWMVVANDATAGTTNGPVWDFTTEAPAAPTIVAPANESTTISINTYIDWAAGAGGSTVVSWDVFFGTDSANVTDKDVSTRVVNDGAAATTIVSNADLVTFLGDTLLATTKYYWKVVANDGATETDGPLWEFTTKATVNPAIAVIGTPADAATDIVLAATLNWTDGVETDAVTGYDLYFSHEAGPVYSMLDIAKVVDDTDVLTYDPTGDMDGGTTYYWRLVARDGDLDTATGPVWSFTTVSVNFPAAAHTPTAADDATDIVVTADLTWQNGDPAPANIDPVATYDLYISSDYALVAGKNASVKELAAQAATDANANSVQTFDIDVDYSGTSFAPGTLFYWMVVATDGDGDNTDGPIWAFTTAGDAPVEPELLSPTNAATSVNHATVALSFNIPAAGGGTESAAANFDVYLSTDINNVNTPVEGGAFEIATDIAPSGNPEGVTNNAIETALGIGDGEIPYNTTYYWCVVTEDADNDRTSSDVFSFTTEVDPTQNIYVTYGADNATYADNNKKAGLSPDATDSYDSGTDIPIPPDPSSHMSTYFYRSDFSDYQQKLTEEWKDYDDYTLTTGVAKYDFQVATDQTDLVTITLDATTGNTDSHPVILWSENVNGGEYQNVLGSDADNTYTFTPDGTTTYNFTLLVGDGTGPVVTPVLPDPDCGVVAGDTTTFPRSSSTTINIDLDDTCPVRSMTLEYSLSDNDADPRNVRNNFVALAASPVTYSSWDDPVADGGIYNANLTLDWIPVSEAGINSSTLEYDAQLRFVVTDWAGNSTTSIVDVIIGSDEFTYPVDDYNDAGGNGWGTGWHLISVPLTPDDDPPADVFGDITGNFSVFKWTEAAGMVAETDVSIANGYWLSLDAAQATGLGDVQGTLAGAADNVDLTLAPSAWNLVGITVRNDDLGGNTIEGDDWVFSDDNFVSTYTWAEATSTADKGGDSNIWISGTSLKTFDNNAGDYGSNIAATAALTPGYGYMLQAGTVTAGALKMRSVRDNIDNDSVEPVDENGETGTSLDDLDEEEGEFFVPIRIAMNDFYNELSGFGTHPEATDGWDNNHDVNAPPLPPSGHYVRAIMDHQDWEAPFGRYFVRDIRSLYDEGVTEMSWDFKVYASEVGNVTMSFLASPEDYNLPEGFTATAIVNETQEFDLLESQEISFNYAGGQIPVRVELRNQANDADEFSTLPTEYDIHSVYPNPFNPSTVVKIALPETANLTVTIFNVLGKQVATLASGNLTAGYHNFVFNADGMASGVYFVRASVPNKFNQISKVVLVR